MPCRYESCEFSGTSVPCPHHAYGKSAKDYDVWNAEIEKKLRELGRIIGSQIPDGWGFALFISNDPKQSDDEPNTSYISSFERPSFINNLIWWLKRQGYVVFKSSARKTKNRRK